MNTKTYTFKKQERSCNYLVVKKGKYNVMKYMVTDFPHCCGASIISIEMIAERFIKEAHNHFIEVLYGLRSGVITTTYDENIKNFLLDIGFDLLSNNNKSILIFNQGVDDYIGYFDNSEDDEDEW